MRLFAAAALLALTTALAAQAPNSAPDPFAALAFLEGTWSAQSSQAQGSAGATAYGTYTFRHELDRHILARHARTADCKAPAGFDCDHNDLLYIFAEAPGAPLRAIYFDNEGHVLHYTVTTPTPTSAIFLSEPGPGPQFRLTYELKNGVMSGKFQMHPPGPGDWQSYLEWTGAKQ